jgi:hypothetical protein
MTQIRVRFRLIFFNPKWQVRDPILDDRKKSIEMAIEEDEKIEVFEKKEKTR